VEEITVVSFKSGTDFHAFVDLPNTFHHPQQLLLLCHRAAGELLKHNMNDCGYKGHNIAYAMAKFRKGLM